MRSHQPSTFQQLLLIYSFKFRSVFLYYLFSALATPRSAISAFAELLFPPVTFNLDLWPSPSNLILIVSSWTKYLNQMSFSSHVNIRTDRRTHTGPVALPGPLKWRVISTQQRFSLNSCSHKTAVGGQLSDTKLVLACVANIQTNTSI